ncbi:MAG TPA: hypothetical protein VHQ41_00210, partial [Patescibacteria group bacterium]|nr:hypothetical protein [Patescibacteria group bacterium]
KYNSVTFYAQSNGKSLILGAGSISKTGSKYTYSYTWNNAPASGSYNVYARSDTGITSDKVSINVP